MKIKSLLVQAQNAVLTWSETPSKVPLLRFEDDKTYDLGDDSDGSRFAEITRRMLSGHYYPPDVLVAYGQFREENRDLRNGDRIIQIANVLGVKLVAVSEMFVVESGVDRTKIGYITTSMHFARGIWSSELTRKDGHLSLHVLGTVVPKPIFWATLPVSRGYQKRAWRRAVETFRAI